MREAINVGPCVNLPGMFESGPVLLVAVLWAQLQLSQRHVAQA